MHRLLEKRRKEIRNNPNYVIPGILLDSSEFQEIFAPFEDEHEESDTESLIYESDTENEVNVHDCEDDKNDDDNDDNNEDKNDDNNDDNNDDDDTQVREAYRVFDKERVGHITAAELRSGLG